MGALRGRGWSKASTPGSTTRSPHPALGPGHPEGLNSSEASGRGGVRVSGTSPSGTFVSGISLASCICGILVEHDASRAHVPSAVIDHAASASPDTTSMALVLFT